MGSITKTVQKTKQNISTKPIKLLSGFLVDVVCLKSEDFAYLALRSAE